MLTGTGVDGVLGHSPLVECVTQTDQHEGAQHDEHDDPSDGDFVAIVWLWWLWNEWIDALWQGFISNISIQKSVSSNVKSGSLLRIIPNSVIVFKDTEELLEEHTTQDDVLGLWSVGVQVADVDLALLSTTGDLDTLGESGKWNSHVVARVVVGEVELEVEFVQGSVVDAWGWQGADSINSVLALSVSASDVLEESNELRVKFRWETETLEVGVEFNWELGVQWLEVLG